MLAKMDDMEMYNLYYMYEIASYTCKWLSLLIFMLGEGTQNCSSVGQGKHLHLCFIFHLAEAY